MRMVILFFATGCLMFFAYCNNHTAHPATNMTTATDADDSSIRVHPGESFTIKLKAAVGNGFSWKLVDSSFQYIRQTRKENFEPGNESIPGTDGTQVFYFKAMRPGKEIIRFIYLQPFIKPVPTSAPRKQFTILIQ